MDIPCVGAVIRDDAGRIVVVQRGRPPNAGLWSIPGGRVEPGESAEDAVRREVREETGLHIELGAVAGSVVLAAPAAADRYLVTDYFATVVPAATTPLAAGDDAADARWVTRAELLTLDLTPGLADTLAGWQVWD